MANTNTPESNKKQGDERTTLTKRLLADTYFLALKTQGFHWNVTGRNFAELHTLFETQYDELYTAGDEIAERLRALRMPSPASFKAFSKIASVTEEEGDMPPRGTEMVKRLVQDNEMLSKLARDLAIAAAAVDDVATADLATRRAQAHDKAAWMLRATCEDDISAEMR